MNEQQVDGLDLMRTETLLQLSRRLLDELRGAPGRERVELRGEKVAATVVLGEGVAHLGLVAVDDTRGINMIESDIKSLWNHGRRLIRLYLRE